MTLLTDLARAKATFQARTLQTILTEGRDMRHRLDGNAIAADRHYGQDRASDFDFCDRCGRPFNTPDFDGNTWSQHPTLFMFCEDCGDEMEDEHD